MRAHRNIDDLSLELHRCVADKLRQQPVLLDAARAYTQRWRERVRSEDDGSRRYLEEWDKLLKAGPDAYLRVLTEQSERATALRHASPFAGVLTPQERMLVIERLRRQRATRPA